MRQMRNNLIFKSDRTEAYCRKSVSYKARQNCDPNFENGENFQKIPTK